MSPDNKSKKVLTLLGVLLIIMLLAYQFKRTGTQGQEAASMQAGAATASPGHAEEEGKSASGKELLAAANSPNAGNSTLQSVKPLVSATPAKGIPGYARKPVDAVVEFEVKEGYAVAFGDLVLGKPPADFDQLRGLAEVARPNLWLRGEVPYMIQPDVPNPERIQAAIQLFHQSTGLKFVPHTNQPDALAFTQTEENCSSYLGRVGGLQPVFLSDKCSAVDIAHEMMHALGFVHEQSRTDRDQFVTIEWENIQDKFQNQYAMVPDALMEIFGDSPFDPNSILMYGRNAFAINPQKPTMKLKNGADLHITPKGLSESDIERVNRLYRE